MVHVRQTLVRNLLEGSVELPEGTFTMKELGIGYPIFVLNSTLAEEEIPNPYYQDDLQDGYAAGGIGAKPKPKPKDKEKKKDPNNVESWPALRYEFIVQFVWQEKPLSVRREERRKAAEAAKAGSNEAASGVSALPIAPAVEEVPPAEEPVPDPEAAEKPVPAEGSSKPMPEEPDPAVKPAPEPEAEAAAAEGGK